MPLFHQAFAALHRADTAARTEYIASIFRYDLSQINHHQTSLLYHNNKIYTNKKIGNQFD
jgi:hypothetical protein